MSTINDITEEAGKKVKSFMSGKPVWAFWILYTAIVGLVFGIAYAVIYILAFKWWILLIAILLTGLCLGTLSYFKENKKDEAKGKSAK